MKSNFFKRFFKQKYPYAPIAFLGRKNVEKALGADIMKYKKLQNQQEQEQQDKNEQNNTKDKKD